MKFISLVFLIVLCIQIDQSLAQWTMPGRMHGTVRALGTIGNTFVAGTDYGYVYYSTDQGEVWHGEDSRRNMGVVRAFAVAGNKIFAGTENGCYVSSDSGRHWLYGPHVYDNVGVNAWCVKGGNIFTATAGRGIYMSEDNGESWRRINNGLRDTSYVFALALCQDKLYASVRGEGIFISSDFGKSWKPLNEGLVYNGQPQLNIQTLAAGDSSVFAGATHWIFKLANNTSKWIWTGQEGFFILSLYAKGKTVYAGYKFSEVKCSKDDGKRWFGRNVLLRRSSDEWPVSRGTSAFAIIDSVIFVSLGQGLYRSIDDEISWKTAGFTDAIITDIISFDNTLLASTQNYGVLISTDRGGSWKRSNKGLLSKYIQSLTKEDTCIFAGTKYDGIFRSTDKGKSWIQINSADEEKSWDSWSELKNGCKELILNSIIPFGRHLLAGTHNGVYKSVNNGKNWEVVRPEFRHVVNALAADEEYLYAGTDGKGIWRIPLSEIIKGK
ncbi:MAG: WD40/YVTN/BNR-like repeat-containing protein [Methanococcaceae archaeon]